MKTPLFGSAITGASSTSVTQYWFITQTFSQTNGTATEATRSLPFPNTFTISRLNIKLSTAPSTGKSWDFTVMKNGVATALTVHVADTGTTASDTADTVTFNSGDLISLQSIPNGAPTAPGNWYWNLIADSGDTNNYGVIFGSNVSLPSVTATNYTQVFGGNSFAWDTTELNVENIIATGGTLNNLNVKLSASPGTSKSYAVSINKNGSNSALTTTISGANTTGSDITDTLSIAAGDTVSIETIPTATPAQPQIGWSMQWNPTTNGETPVGYGNSVAPSASATNFDQILGAGRGSYNATESVRQSVPADSVVLSAIYIKLGTAPGVGNSRTFTVRNSSANTAAAVAISDANTTGHTTGLDVAITQGQLVDLQSAITGTPAALTGGVHMGLIFYIAPPATQLGKARVSTSVTWTVAGAGRVSKSLTSTKAGMSRITNTVTTALTGVARVQNTQGASTTQVGQARISATETSSTLGLARVAALITATRQGLARIALTRSTTQSGLAKIGYGPYATAVLADMPQAYYRMSESSGTSMIDVIAAANGTYIGSPTLGTTGLVSFDPNKAVTFSGSPRYATVPVTPNLTAFSVELVYKPTAIGTSGRIVDWQDTGPVKGFRLEQTGSKFTFVVQGSGAASAQSGTMASASTYHIVGTYDGSKTRLYVNNALVATSNGTTTMLTPAQVITLMRQASTSGSFASGVVDELALYSVALSAGQVNTHYNAAFPGTSQAGTARITATATKTQTGKSRIAKINSLTQTGTAKLLARRSATVTGRSSVSATATKQQFGTARIRRTVTQNPSQSRAVLGGFYFGQAYFGYGSAYGIKVLIGTQWLDKPIKYWDGTQWKLKPMKRWNGVRWR